MSDKNSGRFSDNMLRVGTPECAFLCAVAGMALALLLLFAGFWRTVFVALLVVIGVFIGGVKDKKQWCADRINRLFPAPKPYREHNEAIVKAVREATGASQAPEEVDGPPAE